MKFICIMYIFLVKKKSNLIYVNKKIEYNICVIFVSEDVFVYFFLFFV